MTTLLHEVYVNLAGRDSARFPDRGRFIHPDTRRVLARVAS